MHCSRSLDSVAGEVVDAAHDAVDLASDPAGRCVPFPGMGKAEDVDVLVTFDNGCLLYTSPSPRDS